MANGFHAVVRISVLVSSPTVYDSNVLSRVPTQLPGEFSYAVEFSGASGQAAGKRPIFYRRIYRRCLR